MSLDIFGALTGLFTIVNDGQHALRFTLGRARAVVGPGIHFKVPLLQRFQVEETKHTTLDLEPQVIQLNDSLVYEVDCKVVYQIVNLRKAVIEIDELVTGLQNRVVIAVQQIVSRKDRHSVTDVDQMCAEIREELRPVEDQWGVRILQFGFSNISPSPTTLEITQLELLAREKLELYGMLRDEGLGEEAAVALVSGAVVSVHPDSAPPSGRRRKLQDAALLGAIEEELEEGGAARPKEAEQPIDPFDLDEDDEPRDSARVIQDPDQETAAEAAEEAEREREREEARKKRDERRGGQKMKMFLELFESFKDEILLVVVGTAATLVRAAGVTIVSGTTGLLFSFGRARRELQPGFHFLIPFLQRARRLPTRSRTLDLPSQRVATLQGLVYHVDANLVYRIVDVRKALIQIDKVEKGMIQMLGLGVQEVLRSMGRDELRVSARLDRDLEANLQERLAPWGVDVEHAGFPSITPSRQTLRITQLEKVTGERRTSFDLIESSGIPRAMALGLIGTRHMPRGKTASLIQFEQHRPRMRRLKKLLIQRGWQKAEIKQAEYRLLARITTPGRLRPSVSR